MSCQFFMSFFMTVLSIKFQLFVAASVWVNFFAIGLWLGSPTVVIPQLRREANSTAVVSDEMESWLCKTKKESKKNWPSQTRAQGYRTIIYKNEIMCVARESLLFLFLK